MKRLILFVLVLYFASAFAAGPVLALAKEATPSATSPQPVPVAKVEYNLPYPGLLPDSPLYILKVARDRIVEFFIRDPKQLAFYQLFLSDKRIAAGQVLINNGKPDLGVTTILQAQDYYRQAVDRAAKLKDNNLQDRLVVAGSKHEDVITQLQPKVTGQAATKLGNALLADQKDRNRVLELLIKE